MKRLLTVLSSVFILAYHNASAQRGTAPTYEPRPAPGELFVGNWAWASGADVFQLTLTRNPNWQNPADPKHRIMVVVTGQHSYMRNGVIIEQSFTNNAEPYSLFGAPVGNTSITMGFHDLTKNKRGDVVLILDPATPDRLVWQLRTIETVYVYPAVPPSSGFTVPVSMTLTRQ